MSPPNLDEITSSPPESIKTMSESNKSTIEQEDALTIFTPSILRDAKSKLLSTSDVTIVNLAQAQTDTFFRAMAESAVRAVWKTEKVRYLSPEKYHLWRDMKLNFDPSDMFG